MSELSESQKSYVEKRVNEAAVDIGIAVLQGHVGDGEEQPDQRTLDAMIVANQVAFYSGAYHHWDRRKARCIAQGASKDKSLDAAVINMRMSKYALIFCVTRVMSKELPAIVPNPKKKRVEFQKEEYDSSTRKGRIGESWLLRD